MKEGGRSMVNEKRLVHSFMEYVKISSHSKKEKEFADFIRKELEDLGLETYIDSVGEKIGGSTGNVIARLEGNKNKYPILFSCHLDTVMPGKEIKPLEKEGKIVSDGTTILGADDKAGIAAVIEALKVIKESNIEHGPIEIVFSICEEIGLLGVRNLDFGKIKSQRAFVLDSGGQPGEIVVQGPAQDNICVKILGKEAHAGVSPEKGISAIEVAAHAISNMRLLRIDQDTTANIGVIQGGEATNIVTPEVVIKAEARSLDEKKLEEQTKHMLKCFEEAAKKFKAKIEIEIGKEYKAFHIGEEDELVAIVRKACKNIGIQPLTKKTGGGSDTNIYNEYGIRAVNLATGEGNAHTKEEYIRVRDLVTTANIVMEIIKLHR